MSRKKSAKRKDEIYDLGAILPADMSFIIARKSLIFMTML